MMLTRRVRVLATVIAALVAAAPGAAGAVVSAGHSGWSWSNPPPQGEGITDLAFSGTTGYAVGGFGTLLRTTDGGDTWTGLPSTTVQDLTRVGAVGPTGFVTTGGCAVRRSTDAGTTLSRIDVGGGDTGCGSAVVAAAFSDVSNGLIVFQSGVVLGTTDGGLSLSRRTPVPGPAPTDLVSVSPTTAYATNNNTIYRTVDAAASWTLVAVAPRTLRSLSFATASVGYAVGDGGTVMKTIDGGATWLPVATLGVDLSRVRCADAGLCLFTVSSGGSLVRTADGGATFTQLTASGSPVRAIAFVSPTRAVAAGDGGTMVVSDDGGVTWRTLGTPIAGEITAVRAVTAGFGYTVGPTAIALTADGGQTWRTLGIPTSLSIRTAVFTDPLTGFAQDQGDVLRRTVNGGASWQILDPGLAAGPLQQIVATGGPRVLLVTANGIARSVDGGESFTPVSSRVLRRSAVIRRGILSTAGAGKRVLLAGRAGLLVSKDGGATWKQPPLPRGAGRAPAVVRADCAAPGTCWILTTSGRAYRTTTAGVRWSEVTGAIGVPLRAVTGIAAGGAGEAFLTLLRPPPFFEGTGLVLHTADGGRTWAPQLVGRDAVASIDAVAGRAWALAPAGRIFTTATGGVTATPSTLTIAASRRVIHGPTAVTIRGRLKGAVGGEQIGLYATGLTPRLVTVASSGSFTATLRLRRTTRLVAQWAGDGIRSGDGTPALIVRRS